MRLEIDQARLVVLNAVDVMDANGNKAGRYAIAQSKILVPIMATRIIDECMQLYGGQGLTQHTPLPEMWTYARFVRIADGPDSAHRHQVGRDELKTAEGFKNRNREYQRRYKELASRMGVKYETFHGVTPEL
jgi:alkylation response protein AidB-like acyl-CoA dehydrogenase